ncbi:hypothetical protein QQ045_031292 [Rhodiola kirilowii]
MALSSQQKQRDQLYMALSSSSSRWCPTSEQNHKARERQKLRRSKFMQYQKHLQLNLLEDHHQPYCLYHYSASFTPLALPQGGAGDRCWLDINGIGAGVHRSFQSQLCNVGQPLLKTLELFPLKSTNLNSNANPNKDPTSSSRSSSSY